MVLQTHSLLDFDILRKLHAVEKRSGACKIWGEHFHHAGTWEETTLCMVYLNTLGNLFHLSAPV